MSETIKRYTDAGTDPWESPDGEFVKFADYEALCSEFERVQRDAEITRQENISIADSRDALETELERVKAESEGRRQECLTLSTKLKFAVRMLGNPLTKEEYVALGKLVDEGWAG